MGASLTRAELAKKLGMDEGLAFAVVDSAALAGASGVGGITAIGGTLAANKGVGGAGAGAEAEFEEVTTGAVVSFTTVSWAGALLVSDGVGAVL